VMFSANSSTRGEAASSPDPRCSEAKKAVTSKKTVHTPILAVTLQDLQSCGHSCTCRYKLQFALGFIDPLPRKVVTDTPAFTGGILQSSLNLCTYTHKLGGHTPDEYEELDNKEVGWELISGCSLSGRRLSAGSIK
jgi:hypothetical protein